MLVAQDPSILHICELSILNILFGIQSTESFIFEGNTNIHGNVKVAINSVVEIISFYLQSPLPLSCPLFNLSSLPASLYLLQCSF